MWRAGFCFVLNLVFITCYMQPVGLWQRLCRCPLEDSDDFLKGIPVSYLEPACAVIVRCPGGGRGSDCYGKKSGG